MHAYTTRYYESSQIAIAPDKLFYTDAVALIQCAERARQGRVRFKLMNEMKKSEAFRLHREKHREMHDTERISRLFSRIPIEWEIYEILNDYFLYELGA